MDKIIKDNFDLVERPKVGQRGINPKRYNMFNCNDTVAGVAYAQNLLVPSGDPTLTIEPFTDYVLTGLYKSLSIKSRAGVVTGITDVRVNLIGVQRIEMPDNFSLNSSILQLQFYDNPYIPLRLQVQRNFIIQVFGLQEGNFQVGDIVDATIITEFEYIGV